MQINRKISQSIQIAISQEQNPVKTITIQRPQIIIRQLFKLATYVWIDAAGQMSISRQKQIQEKTQTSIKFVKTAKEAKQACKYSPNQSNDHDNDNNIIIAHISLIRKIHLFLNPMIKSQKITYLLFHGIPQPNDKNIEFQTNTKYLNTQQQILQQIKKTKYQYARPIETNFLPHSHAKTAIIRNIIPGLLIQPSTAMVSSIMELFRQLALLLYREGSQLQIEDFMEQYAEKGYMNQSEALLWYTKESFVYRFVNLILRTSCDPSCLYIIQPYFRDLFNSIRKMHKKQQGQINKKFTCYRGAHISSQQLQYFKNNIGGYVHSLGFLSTSVSPQRAQNFARNAFIQIQVDNDNENRNDNENQQCKEGSYGYVDLKQFTYVYSGEQEILFNFMSCFKIIGYSPKDQTQYTNLHKIVLKYMDKNKISAGQENKLSQKLPQYNKISQKNIKQMQQCKKLGEIELKTSGKCSRQKGNVRNSSSKKTDC